MGCRFAYFHHRLIGIILPLTHLTILALIQGLTEFLPISSSGHLIIFPKLLDWQDQGITIDVAVHAGSLLAVLIFLWRDIGRILSELSHLARSGRSSAPPLLYLLLIASLPLIVVGFLVSTVMQDLTRSIEVIGWATILFGVLLGFSDRMGMTLNRFQHMKYFDAFLIGLAQILALIPGASRAGVTITAARFLGYERASAARFSLLLAIPAILGASVLKGLDIFFSDNVNLGIDFLIAASISFCAALTSISIMMKWLNRAGFMPFVVYRIIMGALLLAWVYL